MKRINNLHELLERRRELRKNMTYAEKILWHQIRDQKLGVKFRRQHSRGRFIIDSFCTDLELAIEVDGETHLDEEVKQYDAWRQSKLEAQGIQFIRIPNVRFWNDGDQVIKEICEAIAKRQKISSQSIRSEQIFEDDPSPAKGKVAEGRMGLVGATPKFDQWLDHAKCH
jgi:very-short-patch-repair endonuclease